MKKSIKIKDIARLIVFCLLSFLLVYFSKYVFGKCNEIKIEKRICIKGAEGNNLIRKKIGSFHVENFQTNLNINSGKISLNNMGDSPIWPYSIYAKNNINESNIDDTIYISVEIENMKVYEGRLRNIFNDNGGCFKVLKKIQPNNENRLSIIISSRNKPINKINDLSFDLYLFSVTKDLIDSELYTSKNRMYIGGYYSQEYDRYINEFWAECLQVNDEIWFCYNKTSYNKGFEYITLDINNKNIKGCRVICFKNAKVISVDGVMEEDIKVDWENNIIKIKKSALSRFGSGINIRIGSAKTLTSNMQMTSYKYYSLAI